MPVRRHIRGPTRRTVASERAVLLPSSSAGLRRVKLQVVRKFCKRTLLQVLRSGPGTQLTVSVTRLGGQPSDVQRTPG
jgi:hypothetical protein